MMAKYAAYQLKIRTLDSREREIWSETIVFAIQEKYTKRVKPQTNVAKKSNFMYEVCICDADNSRHITI